jgi:formamidopyrimidine-DNA glycosylase
VRIDFGFPRTKTRTRPSARGATLFAVTTSTRAVFGFEVIRLVDAEGVVIAKNVVRACQHAPSATGTQAARNDFVPEVGPVGFVGFRFFGNWGIVNDGHTYERSGFAQVWRCGTIRIVPELVEIEIYRRAAEAMLDREISDVVADDAWFLKEGTSREVLVDALIGMRFVAARRHGKLLMLDVASSDHVLGLRFGMTGRLVVDGGAAIETLLYSSHRSDPKFVRFSMTFADGGRAELSDPRRLGGVALNPSVTGLGPDAARIPLELFRAVCQRGSVAIKARLLDQSRIAGVGNLIADEVLWRAGVSPLVLCDSLRGDRLLRLHTTLIDTIADLQERGGSHMGDLMVSRTRDGVCPRCASLLRRDTVGGRTTFWCPNEQT